MGIETLTPTMQMWAWFIATLVAFIALCVIVRKVRQSSSKYHGVVGTTVKLDTKPYSRKPASLEPMMSCNDVLMLYRKQHYEWREKTSQVEQRCLAIERTDLRVMSVEDVLQRASMEERANLAAILGMPRAATPQEMVKSLREAGSHSVASMIRRQPVTYEQVVKDAVEKLGASHTVGSHLLADLELIAVTTAMQKILLNATPEQRSLILAEFADGRSKSNAKLATATGALLLANFSGFGLYMAASSSLAALTGAVGLTLPFAAYAGMSSVLATVTGPVGWAALLVVATVKFGGVNYKKTVPGVIAVALPRLRLIAEQEREMVSLTAQKKTLEGTDYRLRIFCRFCDDMQRRGLDQVPASTVPAPRH